MNGEKHIIDFRNFKPTAILVIDLVKHSKRTKQDINEIQKILVDIFEDSIKRLKIDDVNFNYTGDGYMIAFVGNSSVRVLDFINIALPQLNERLSKFNQKIRAGLDYGLVHFNINNLTKSAEHFDLPGIQAARLEAKAEENQILASEIVYKLFNIHYSDMFGEALQIKTKDREIVAHSIRHIDLCDVRVFFEKLFFDKLPDSLSPIGDRNKILFVDDEHCCFKDLYKPYFPEFEIDFAFSGSEALEKFKPGEFALVVTDEMMPGMLGHELTEKLVQLDSELPVVMMTCYSAELIAKRFFASGGTYFLFKIDSLEHQAEIFKRSITINNLRQLRDKLHIITDDIGKFIYVTQLITYEFNSVITNASHRDELAFRLIRHKAKQIILSLIDAIVPGNNVMDELDKVVNQLKSLNRMLRSIGSVNIKTLKKHIVDYTLDMMELHPKVKIEVNFENESSLKNFTYAGILALVICELVDNSIDSINGEGIINTSIKVLNSARILQVKVKDSGDGVSESILGSMFDLGVSSKGTGRGVGLCLIKEAISSLSGQINYSFNEGAVFTIKIPI